MAVRGGEIAPDMRATQPPAGISTIGAVARYGPPDDFNRQPTQYADYGGGGYRPSGPPPPPTEPPAPEPAEPVDLDAEPAPWYRRPVMLIGWGLLVVILIALIVYGITELLKEAQGTSHTPSQTATTTVPPTTTTTPPAPSETTTEPPTTSSAVEPPPQPTRQPTHQKPAPAPSTHHHLPPLPSVITIPGMPNPITLPPGLTH